MDTRKILLALVALVASQDSAATRVAKECNPGVSNLVTMRELNTLGLKKNFDAFVAGAVTGAKQWVVGIVRVYARDCSPNGEAIVLVEKPLVVAGIEYPTLIEFHVTLSYLRNTEPEEIQNGALWNTCLAHLRAKMPPPPTSEEGIRLYEKRAQLCAATMIRDQEWERWIRRTTLLK